MSNNFKRERRIRERVVQELLSGRHVQLRYGKGDWESLCEPVCFAHVVKRTLHKLGEPHGTQRNNSENVGNRISLGIHSGDYNKLVQMNDKGVPFNILATVLKDMPYRHNKNYKG